MACSSISSPGTRSGLVSTDSGSSCDRSRSAQYVDPARVAAARRQLGRAEVERTVRDFLTEEIDEVICDNREATERMSEYIRFLRSRVRTSYRQGKTKQPSYRLVVADSRSPRVGARGRGDAGTGTP